MISNQTKPISLISFGEILWDFIDGQAHLGGAALNLAAHASRLGLHARLISCVGDDDLGRKALGEASRFGVDVSGTTPHPDYPTGVVLVELAGSQPEYSIQGPAAWDFIEAVPPSFFCADEGHMNAVCFGTLAQRSPASRRALQRLITDLAGAPSYYDVNLRQDFFTKELIEWGFQHATVVKVNDAEADIISRLLFRHSLSCADFAKSVRKAYGTRVVLVTLGADGCLVGEDSGMTHVAGTPVQVVDTVGAGDAFSAGFLSSWLRGNSAVAAATLGNALGAYTASQRGAVPDYTNQLISQLATSGVGS